MTENLLLEAVQGLTRPVVTKVIQDGPVGSGLAGTHVAKVSQTPLLTQLEEAIRGTIGIGGSGSLARERNMLDADALHRFSVISSQIREWALAVGAEVHKGDAVRTLESWYRQYVMYPRDTEQFYTGQLLAWAAQITEKLNPKRVWDMPDACPACGAASWVNPADGLPYLRPLVIEYEESGPNLIQEARALCRACAKVWGVRDLAWDLERVAADKAI